MYCVNCGKQLEENSRFCDGCGANQEAQGVVQPSKNAADTPAFSETTAVTSEVPQPQHRSFNQQNSNLPQQGFVQQPQNINQPQSSLSQEDYTKPMTVWQYILTFLILIVPILNIVKLFMWAFGSQVNLNKKNFARAYLILFVIIIVLWIVIGASIYGSILKNLGDFNIGNLSM